MHVQPVGSAPFSFVALGLGALALTVALIATYVGPFAPTQDVGVALGEIAGDMIKSTVREVFGRPQPEAVVRAWTIDDWLQISVVIVAVIAILLSIVALFKREARVIAVGALSVAAAALVFQFIAWMTLVIACAILIFSVLSFFSGGL